jgi:hypothetical protein
MHLIEEMRLTGSEVRKHRPIWPGGILEENRST